MGKPSKSQAKKNKAAAKKASQAAAKKAASKAEAEEVDDTTPAPEETQTPEPEASDAEAIADETLAEDEVEETSEADVEEEADDDDYDEEDEDEYDDEDDYDEEDDDEDDDESEVEDATDDRMPPSIPVEPVGELTAPEDPILQNILLFQWGSVFLAIFLFVAGLLSRPGVGADGGGWSMSAAHWGMMIALGLLVFNLIALIWTRVKRLPVLVISWSAVQMVSFLGLAGLVLIVPMESPMLVVVLAGAAIFSLLASLMGMRWHGSLLALGDADEMEEVRAALTDMPGMRSHETFISQAARRRQGMTSALGHGLVSTQHFGYNTLVAVENLTKYYGPTCALEDVTFGVDRGEIVGFLGPNGAGKSTAMKILTTYLRPTNGRAVVGGYDVSTHPLEVRKRVGYLPESNPLYREMRVSGYLEYIARARHLPEAQRKKNLAWVREVCQLERVWHMNIDELSKGFRQRVGLAQAIIHEPDILILDEPSSGLDPNQIIEMRSLIKEVGRNKTVLLSTHILQEVAALCTRILVIDQGQLVANGTIDELGLAISQHGWYRLTMTDGNDLDAAAIASELEALPQVHSVEVGTEGGHKLLTIHPGIGRESGDQSVDEKAWQERFSLELATLCTQKGWPLRDLRHEYPSLEDIFVNLTMHARE